MGYRAFLVAVWRSSKAWLLALLDATPPYRYAEGHLIAKEADPVGKFYIVVESARIEVDRNTFDILTVGEDMRVRYTRRGRAVNIDRYVPPSNGSERS